jgi:hypothetical protein
VSLLFDQGGYGGVNLLDERHGILVWEKAAISRSGAAVLLAAWIWFNMRQKPVCQIQIGHAQAKHSDEHGANMEVASI